MSLPRLYSQISAAPGSEPCPAFNQQHKGALPAANILALWVFAQMQEGNGFTLKSIFNLMYLPLIPFVKWCVDLDKNFQACELIKAI